jgi:hypothetical protein
MPANPPRSATVVKPVEDQAWRGRVMLACGLLLVGLMAGGALNLDWSADPAMAAGQLAGMAAPVVLLAVAVWALASRVGRKG